MTDSSNQKEQKGNEQSSTTDAVEQVADAKQVSNASEDASDGYVAYPVNAGPDRKTMIALTLVIASFFVALIVVVLIHVLVPSDNVSPSDGYPALGPEVVANAENGNSK